MNPPQTWARLRNALRHYCRGGSFIDIPETPEEEEWLSKQDFHNGADQAYTGLSIDPADAGLIEYGAPDACSIEDQKSGRKGC